MEDKYKGTAILESGERVTVSGSLRQVANWADNLISISGTCEIKIEKENERG